MKNFISTLRNIFTKYILPPVLISFFIVILTTFVIKLMKPEGIGFSYYILFDTPLKAFHTLALLASLTGQYSIALFYTKRKIFDGVSLEFESDTVSSGFAYYDLIFPFLTGILVFISLLLVNNHGAQEIFNIIYLLLIVIWDFIYWRYTKPQTGQEKVHEKCKEYSQGLLFTDSLVCGSFVLLFIGSLIFEYFHSSEGLAYKAGSYNMILIFSSLLLLKEIFIWERKFDLH